MVKNHHQIPSIIQPAAQIITAAQSPGAAAVLPLSTEAVGSRATGKSPNAKLDIAGGAEAQRRASHRPWRFLKVKIMGKEWFFRMVWPESVEKRMETIGIYHGLSMVIIYKQKL